VKNAFYNTIGRIVRGYGLDADNMDVSTGMKRLAAPLEVKEFSQQAIKEVLRKVLVKLFKSESEYSQIGTIHPRSNAIGSNERASELSPEERYVMQKSGNRYGSTPGVARGTELSGGSTSFTAKNKKRQKKFNVKKKGADGMGDRPNYPTLEDQSDSGIELDGVDQEAA
jgi:hypothetical protein